MQHLVYFLLFLLFYNSVAAKNKIKYGEVPYEDLKMKLYANDSTAEAVILNKSCVLTWKLSSQRQLILNYEYFIRIKIINNAGLGYADIQIPYIGYDQIEKVVKIKAHSVNLENEKPVYTELSRELIFKVNQNQYIYLAKFTLPNVKEGSVIEYTYCIESLNFNYIKKWEFQSEIPTVHNEFVTEIPNAFKYRTSFKGLNNLYTIEKEDGLVDMAINNFYPGLSTIAISRYSLGNSEGLKIEPFCYSRISYLSSVTFQLESISVPGFGTRHYVNNWDDLGIFVMDARWFGDKIKSYKFIKDIVNNTFSNTGIKSKEKLCVIYDYVKSTIIFNGTYNLLIDDLKDVYTKKEGNGSEVNSLLLCLLQECGYEANPVLASSRQNGEFQREYPIITDFNHMIVSVKIDTSTILLDATDPFRPAGEINADFIGKTGYRIIGNKWDWVEFGIPTASRNIYQYDFTVTPSAQCYGTLQYMCSSYIRLSAKKSINENGIESYMNNMFKSNLNHLKIDSAKISKEDFDENKLIINCKLSISCDHEDKLIYLKPFMDENSKLNPFQNETRQLPIEFQFPMSTSSIVNIQLPSGYKLTEMPKSTRIKLSDDSAIFTLLTSSENNKISLKSTLLISEYSYSANRYSEIKNFFSNISKIYAQQIIIEQE